MLRKEKDETHLVTLIIWFIFYLLIILVTFNMNVTDRAERDKIKFEQTSYHNNQCFKDFRLEGESKEVIVVAKKILKPKNKYRNSKVRNVKIIYNHFLNSPFFKMAEEITAMSALETGWWRSDFHNERSNYFSRKRLPDGINCISGEKNCLIRHKNIYNACSSMERYLIRKGYHQDNVEEFLLDLKRLCYAEDPKYIEKVQKTSIHIYNIIEAEVN